jgi:hypothetical protein
MEKTELRIRVKDYIKDILIENKEKLGIPINFQVNFAIYKYLALDVKADLNLLNSYEKSKKEESC